MVIALLAAGLWYAFLRPAAPIGPAGTPSQGPVAVVSPTPRASRTSAPTLAPTTAPTATAAPATPTEPPATAGATPSPGAAPSSGASPGATPSPGSSSGPAASIDPQTLAQIHKVVSEVPGLRGLQPKKDVPFRFITQDQFNQEFQKQFDHDNPAAILTGEEEAAKHLGLLPADASLRTLLLQLYEGQVLAYYDPDTAQFTIIQQNRPFGPSDEITIAHEYDHALQDQYWNLKKFETTDPTQGDKASAETALAEGDATALMYQWAVANLTQAEIAQLGNSSSPESQQALDNAPLVLRIELEFPYLDGLQFVQTVQSQGPGSWSAVNQVWDNPPTSSEQIMHPDRYFAHDEPLAVTLPNVAATLGAGWTTADTETFGELETGIWLANGQQGPPNAYGMPSLPNADAAAGWGGDRLVSLDGPNGAWAVVWQTAWDTSTDAGQFNAAAQTVLSGLPGAHEIDATSVHGSVPTGATDIPQLVLFASDQTTLDHLKQALQVGP